MTREIRHGSGTILLRFELKDGTSRWRPLIDTTDATLCAQCGIDPHRFRFDLPRVAHEIRTADALPLARTIDGFILDRTTGEAIGKVHFVREGEKLRDIDPTDMREFERL